ncbi:MAG: HNH endonuclease [Anaerolineae bacterium]|nr:HNH endonuclease [Anaerolineae bacterium]
MSRSYIGAELRRSVIQRAHGCCEYCRLSQNDGFFSFEVDHILAEKHGGLSVFDNLALSCPDCNAFKGSDFASIDPDTGLVTLLFNPRADSWDDHFGLDRHIVIAHTPTGRVTLKLLKINSRERLEDRLIYLQLGTYPCNPTSE